MCPRVVMSGTLYVPSCLLRSDVGVLLYIHVQVHVVYVPCVCPQCVLVVREFPTLL